MRLVELEVQDVTQREAASDRRDAVVFEERHERALVATHDVEGMVGAPLVLTQAARRSSTRRER